MTVGSLADRLRTAISADGPLPVSAYVEAALYDPDDGFYTGSGRAGRSGDFLTAPEVGPLFGAVLAAALDGWWIDRGRPAAFHVHEWGAGPGTLARTVLAAEPEILRSGALTWWAIERSPSQRRGHPTHPAVRSAPQAPADAAADVVVANELLDNLPFDIYEMTESGWHERRIDWQEGRFRIVTTTAGSAGTRLDRLVPDAQAGSVVPWQSGAVEWLASVRAAMPVGRLVVFDYGASTPTMAHERGDGSWLRTHRRHDGGADWLVDPGSCDITADVAFDQLREVVPDAAERSQAEFLRAHGIEQLVEEGRRIWAERAGVADLAAMRARSRVREAEALLDPAGMGSFRVFEAWFGVS